MTPKELYTRILPHALAAYAQKTPDMESAKQMAHALAKETVDECGRLGVLGAGMTYQEQPERRALGVGVPGVPSFAEGRQAGGGAAPLVPLGAPQQPAQHYNHVGGRDIVPPVGGNYEPPVQAGVMNTVTHVATPDGHSALGTDGVINQPVQRPSGKDVVVAPATQPMIPQVGGNGTKFVPERIVR